jgi:hypothetical protein
MIPMERIESRIYLVRGQKVMLDSHLAELYGVRTHVLNQAVKRNLSRFPDDFMFKLTAQEYDNLKFHFGTSNLKSQSVISSWGGRRKLPYVFTEQGVAMLSSVLNSERAIQVNIKIMRAFVKIKQALAIHKKLALKLDLLEERFGKRLDKHEQEIALIFEAIRKMLTIDEKPRRRIGFVVGKGTEGTRD